MHLGLQEGSFVIHLEIQGGIIIIHLGIRGIHYSCTLEYRGRVYIFNATWNTGGFLINNHAFVIQRVFQ